MSKQHIRRSTYPQISYVVLRDLLPKFSREYRRVCQVNEYAVISIAIVLGAFLFGNHTMGKCNSKKKLNYKGGVEPHRMGSKHLRKTN